jgi:hypothetical protein
LIAIGRVAAAIFGGGTIVFAAGWFSWRDFGDNRLRFYGRLFGGLLLSGAWFYWLFALPLLSKSLGG